MTEVFFMTADDIRDRLYDERYSNVMWTGADTPGWYWVKCTAGYAPSPYLPSGPFATSDEAHNDAND